jgi:hypothetical protein
MSSHPATAESVYRNTPLAQAIPAIARNQGE